MPCIITRGNNVFGSHQYPEKLIPKFINLLERNRPLCLHGDGSHRRSFIYVEDVARAFDTVLHKGIIGEIYNIGTEFEVSNLDVSRALLREYGLADKESEVRAARVLVVGCSVHSFLSFTSHSASPSFVIATSTTVATTSTTAS
jgi:dTDP-D-glucose 4,6-dehydratase